MTTMTTTPNFADLVFESGKQIKTTSLIVAERFEKRHDNVIQSIKNLECSEEFSALNFQEAKYIDEQGKERPAYEMTRDGFAFLCMGFTGAEAAKFKEAFIAAFNQMEAQLKKITPNLAKLQEKFTRDTKFLMSLGNSKKASFAKANEMAIQETGVDVLKLHGYASDEDLQLKRIWKAFDAININNQLNHHRLPKHYLAIRLSQFISLTQDPEVKKMDINYIRKALKSSENPRYIETKSMRSKIDIENKLHMIFEL